MDAADLIDAVLWSNLAGSAGILLVLALRKPARALLGVRLAYGLWLLPLAAALACLLPVRPLVRTMVYALPAPGAGDLAAPLAAVAAAPAPQPFDPAPFVAGLWLLGVLGFAVWTAFKQAHFLQAARVGRAGPAVVGLFKPRIVTPDDFDRQFNPGERSLILAHEQAHVARRDTIACGLLAAVRCLCWFNPLVHHAAFLVVQDQELACDAEVVERYPDARHVYAAAMLKAETAGGPLPLGCFWPAGTRHPLLERIAMLKLQSPGKTRRLLGATALTLACAGLAAAAWAARPPELQVVYRPGPSAFAGQAAAAQTAPAPAPAPQKARQAPAPAAQPNPCLTNACADPAQVGGAQAKAAFNVPGADAQGNVNIGARTARIGGPRAPLMAAGAYNIADVNTLLGLPAGSQTLIACDGISSTREVVCEYSVSGGPVTRVDPKFYEQLGRLGVSGNLSPETYDEANARAAAARK